MDCVVCYWLVETKLYFVAAALEKKKTKVKILSRKVLEVSWRQDSKIKIR